MTSLTLANKEYNNILQKRGMTSYQMNKDISDSWSRCIAEGLNPFKNPKHSIISSSELKQIKEQNESLRKIVIPEIELL